MFDFIRAHRRWMQFILLILILPSFAFVGVQGYTSFINREPELAVVGSASISRPEFDWVLRNQLEQYRAMLGGQFDAAMLDTPALRETLLNQLIDQHVIAQVATDGRLMVSDEALRRLIAARADFQENGSFSPTRYRAFLVGQGMDAVSFESGLRSSMALGRVLGPVSASSTLPLAVVERLQAALTETRTVRTRIFAAHDYRDQVQISDADIKAWYDAHPAQLEIPAHVRADYVVLDEAAASQGITVNDADVAAYYEQNKNRFGQPERRRASHIMVNGTDASARTQAEALAKQAGEQPDRFAELARAHSQDSGSASQGGDLGWIARGMLAAALEQAIFSLPVGQVSDVVESPYGFHVVRVSEIEGERVKPLAEVRAQIEGEIRQQLASARYAEMASRLTDLVYEQRDSLQPVVDALGLRLRSADGIARDGLLSAEQVGEGAAVDTSDAQRLNDPRVRQVLFSPEVQREHLNSGVIELDPGTMIVVRAADVRAAHVPELAAVSAQIRERLRDERAQQAARAAGEAFVQAAQTDADAGLVGMSAPLDVSRRAPGELSQAALEAAMRLPATPLPATVGAVQGQDYVVVRVDAVTAGQVDEAQKTALTELRDGLSFAWGRAEEAAVLQTLRQQYRAEIRPGARAVLQEPENAAL